MQTHTHTRTHANAQATAHANARMISNILIETTYDAAAGAAGAEVPPP